MNTRYYGFMKKLPHNEQWQVGVAVLSRSKTHNRNMMAYYQERNPDLQVQEFMVSVPEDNKIFIMDVDYQGTK